MEYCLRAITKRLLHSGKKHLSNFLEARYPRCKTVKTSPAQRGAFGQRQIQQYRLLSTSLTLTPPSAQLRGGRCEHKRVENCYYGNDRTPYKNSDMYTGMLPCKRKVHDSSNPKEETVTVEKLCKIWTQTLEKQNVPEARSSVEYIIAFILGKKTLYGVERTTQLSAEQQRKVGEMCQLRIQHWPVQYILGEWDFGDLVLKMRPPVFIPRPETEELVSMAARCVQEKNDQTGRLLELCCGSGAIAVSLLHKFPQMTAVAVDISPHACSLTMENADLVGVADRLTVLQKDITSSTAVTTLAKYAPFNLLISNPPYVPSGDMTSLERQILDYEDVGALDGGRDGLDIVRKILNVCPQVMAPDSDVWLEVNPGHPEEICKVVKSSPQLALEFVASHSDFLGRERFCHLQRSSGCSHSSASVS